MKTVFMRIRNIGKSNNKSAIAASAYRSGAKMYDESKNKMYNYSNKKEVVYDTIMLPPNAPQKYKDKQTLWQDVQDNETTSDARYCKDIMIAIPRNLTQEQRVALVNQFLFKNFISKGYVCQFNIHDKGDGNPHAHILVSARPLDKNGQWVKVKSKRVYKLDAQGNKIPIIDPKTGKQKIGARGRKMWQREWAKQDPLDQASSVDKWKKSWRDLCNKVLDKEHQLQVGPEGKYATIHLGPQAAALERKGTKTRIGEKNRQIKIANRKADLQAALFDIDKKLQQDRDIITKIQNEIERIKDLNAKIDYKNGYDIKNYYRMIYATLHYELANYRKEIEYYKNYKWFTEKQIRNKATNIITNGRALKFWRNIRQLKEAEQKIQQKKNEGFDIYDELIALKKRKKELEQEKLALEDYVHQPDIEVKIINKYNELAQIQNAKLARYKDVANLIADYEKLEKRIITEYKKIQDNKVYELYADKSKNITWSEHTSGGPEKISNDLDKLLSAMKPQTPEPQLHNNMRLDLSEHKERRNDDYDLSY